MFRIEGIVEHISFRNARNGYSVVELSTEDGLLTIVGFLPELQPGEPIEAEGSFVIHPLYGRQLSVEHYYPVIPEDALAIERYLASGVIKGIGPQLAARIVSAFGKDTIRILEEDPAALSSVRGISRKGAEKIVRQAAERRDERAALLYMDQFGIPLPLAYRIYEQYGADLYRILEDNPYQLIDDLTRVGFRIADRIAQKIGHAPDSEFRIRSGLQYAMSQALEAGHIFLPLSSLLQYTASLLEISAERISECVTDLGMDSRFVLKEIAGVPVVYLAPYYYMEASSAAMLCGLNQTFPLSESEIREALASAEERSDITLEAAQRDAVRAVIENGLTVITGGPGTGKTTIISAILRYFESAGFAVELAAPTGRAAKRITEATGRPAKTIHRLLEYAGAVDDSDGEGSLLRFSRNESNPLGADVVIIDEASMVDLPLLYALLKAVIPGTRLVLVGDANQLPSVGPGNVLKDIIRSGIVPTISLTRIFRQNEKSDIVRNAHRIIRGEIIDPAVKSNDFIFLPRSTAEEILSVTVRLVREKLPRYVNCAPADIQVITPTRKGALGVENLNQVLQQHLNPPEPSKKERRFPKGLLRVGDKIMQIKNNYLKEWQSEEEFQLKKGTGVFNGDIGVLTDIRFFTEELEIRFDDGRTAVYSFEEADELELAYAITVHKAQGSEYPAVVLPLLAVPAPLMTRPLIYTAVTRAKSCVCLPGSPEVFQRMVDNNTEQRRYSSLHLQLSELSARSDFLRG